MYDMSASQNWLGSTGFGSLLPERIISDLRIPGAVHPSFRYILDTLLRFTGAPNCLASWTAILRVPHVIMVDNGSQYTSRDFRRSVDVLGARLEYIYVNTPQQNGHMESFHKTLKKEYAWPHEFKDAEVAGVAPLEALDDCNRHRIHSAIGYATPDEFAKHWEKANPQEVANR